MSDEERMASAAAARGSAGDPGNMSSDGDLSYAEYRWWVKSHSRYAGASCTNSRTTADVPHTAEREDGKYDDDDAA